jgi:predicted nucleic acid-binding protein
MRALIDTNVILDVLFNREEGLLSPMLMLKI